MTIMLLACTGIFRMLGAFDDDPQQPQRRLPATRYDWPRPLQRKAVERIAALAARRSDWSSMRRDPQRNLDRRSDGRGGGVCHWRSHSASRRARGPGRARDRSRRGHHRGTVRWIQPAGLRSDRRDDRGAHPGRARVRQPPAC